MTLRRAVVATHRWLGLVVAALWVVQALTGIFCVFHWEIEDASVAGAHRATDFRAIERRIAGLDVHSMWTTAAQRDRWELNVPGKSIRVDGAGNTLRVVKDGENPFDKLVELHQSLLAGDRGRFIIGLSGAILFSNLILGVIAAWPKRGQWSRALRPVSTPSAIATNYSWHRAVGLWWCVPAMLLVAAGAILAFNFAEAPEHKFGERGTPRVAMTAAIATAVARFPGAEISGIGFPAADDAVWKITVKQRGEMQRAYGHTRVFVSAVDGHVLAIDQPRAVLDHVFPLHTGELFGVAGRIAALAVGVWLIAMIALGFALLGVRRLAAAFRSPESRSRR